MNHVGLIASVLAFLVVCTLWVLPAHAESGWTWTGKEFAPYHFTPRIPDGLSGQALVVLVGMQRERAMHRARQAHRTYTAKLKRLLAKAESLLHSLQTAIAPSGGVWGCIARWEEGGVNTASHGYFGFMGSPADFGASGSSWLALSWSAQVAIAEGVQQRYGWTAWGPATRARCGL